MLSSAMPEKADPARHAHGKVNAKRYCCSFNSRPRDECFHRKHDKQADAALGVEDTLPYSMENFPPPKNGKIAVQYASPPGGSFP